MKSPRRSIARWWIPFAALASIATACTTVVPEAETRPGGEVASGVASPSDAVETPPSFDTSSLEVPDVCDRWPAARSSWPLR